MSSGAVGKLNLREEKINNVRDFIASFQGSLEELATQSLQGSKIDSKVLFQENGKPTDHILCSAAYNLPNQTNLYAQLFLIGQDVTAVVNLKYKQISKEVSTALEESIVNFLSLGRYKEIKLTTNLP